jgi:alkylation response protein AidB-like acyl-CoA dehydrogenase
MDFALTEAHSMVRKMVPEFAQKEVVPVIKEFDRKQEFLVPLARGEKIDAGAFIKPGTGSDFGNTQASYALGLRRDKPLCMEMPACDANAWLSE